MEGIKKKHQKLIIIAIYKLNGLSGTLAQAR